MTNHLREQIEFYFFDKRKTLRDIAKELSLSEKTVGSVLRLHPDYEAERLRRKKENATKRKAYQREWDREHRVRNGNDVITKESMQREHFMAVAILSREKYR